MLIVEVFDDNKLLLLQVIQFLLEFYLFLLVLHGFDVLDVVEVGDYGGNHIITYRIKLLTLQFEILFLL